MVSIVATGEVVAIEWPASLVTRVVQGSSVVGKTLIKLSCSLAHIYATGMVFAFQKVYYVLAFTVEMMYQGDSI